MSKPGLIAALLAAPLNASPMAANRMTATPMTAIPMTAAIAARLAVIASLILPLAGPAQAEPQSYQIDSGHSSIVFSYNHQGFADIFGLLTGISGTIIFDSENPANSSVDATLPLSALTTGNAARDHDLLSDEYLDAQRFPEVHFRSTSIMQVSENNALITGDLTLNGVTNKVVLNTTLNQHGPSAKGDETLGLSATTVLLRSDFNAGRGAPNNSDVVGLNLSIEARRPEASRPESSRPKATP